ncbi:MAG: 2,3-bisphosphoglycerate-independent phosphoglycerate mutase [Pseudomonadota bacterium]
MKTSPVLLCILDGWGLQRSEDGNAVKLGHTPNFDQLMSDCPNVTLVTHGPDVGLPDGQMGNSEVGHMNIGAGRIVEMDLVRIDRILRDGAFGSLPETKNFIEKAKAGSGRVHVMGVLSDGGVHGHVNQMISVAETLNGSSLDIALHLFSDGRDVAPGTAEHYLEALLEAVPDAIKVGTLSGRFYAMDRDQRWDRVAKAYAAIARGEGPCFQTAGDAIIAARARGTSDEFFEPAVIGDYAGIKHGDAVLMLNYRADRAREILSAIGDPTFDAFETHGRPNLSALAGFTSYSDDHDAYMDCIFVKPELPNTLAAWLSKQGKTQFHVAETEKYPHVTFFFNGGEEQVFDGEVRYLAPSPKVATYDQQPEMSAAEVTGALLDAIATGYDFYIVNFANPDMVGHTGDLSAAIRAVEEVDRQLGKVVDAARRSGIRAVICADHGNCETMIDPETGQPHTAHTTNLVPLILTGEHSNLSHGRLCDIAPTILSLMGLPKPAEMTGRSLVSTGE